MSVLNSRLLFKKPFKFYGENDYLYYWNRNEIVVVCWHVLWILSSLKTGEFCKESYETLSRRNTVEPLCKYRAPGLKAEVRRLNNWSKLSRHGWVTEKIFEF